MKLAKPEKDTPAVNNVQWSPPSENFYKLNVDASFLDSSKRGGWGFVLRDQDGLFLEGGAGNIPRVANALHAEAMAALAGLERAAQLGMERIVLETNESVLGRAITSDTMDQSEGGGLFRRIRDFMRLSFSSYLVSVCPRICNRVADALATCGVSALPVGEHVYWCQAPSFVAKFVSGDKPVARG
ncbi:hypothetical protein PR202_ga21914 [Eleusine coracana subsp. coracana]|uniref:RNase H type-1 domain-containing protein n=1 Tax=Eleusine coracana subsp. coracana TaxID=191504 RepID=A0AAV5D1N8_ELECO|nr:hypothetical protein PR202_ga21914 [Eleusine coracana subsp. coracana]